MYYGGALYVAAACFCKCDKIEWTGGNLIDTRTMNAECSNENLFRRIHIAHVGGNRVRSEIAFTVSADSGKSALTVFPNEFSRDFIGHTL